jgi:hypothetical protein
MPIDWSRTPALMAAFYQIATLFNYSQVYPEAMAFRWVLRTPF